MTQTAIPFLFFRGGTSRGPYFNRADLPKDPETLAQVLLAALGSGHPLNIDGIGGGAAVTTKVAMLSRSVEEGVDIDYFFAQVGVEDRLVDFKPTCGNILSGVGPAAIEMGLVEPSGDETTVRIRAVNTGANIDAVVQTPDGQVTYEGDTAIDGVPGAAAPVLLGFRDVVGSITGRLLPTGRLRDEFDGVTVTCLDVAMPMVIARAQDFGLTGYESPAELDENADLFKRIEAVRLQAGQAMGMGDVAQSVTPKFGLIAPPREGGAIAARYFMPWRTHPTLAVTGSQCLASCVLMAGTVADGIAQPPAGNPVTIGMEHAAGRMGVVMDYSTDSGAEGGFSVRSAGLIRTARKLAEGHLFLPSTVWSG